MKEQPAASAAVKSPTAPVGVRPEKPSRDYCTRLLAVYAELVQRKALIAELPRWTSDFKLSVDQLQAVPRLQAALAGVTSYTPSKWLLEQELSRRRANPESDDLAAKKASVYSDSIDRKSWMLSSRHGAQTEDVYDAANRECLSGLSFSGGGIRSATFCLGILQALAECGKLGNFDYLSTVSGGGYIHSWLASWIRNEQGRFGAVQKRLIPLPEGSQARAPEQITWLRRYSSYLTPQRGLFSADTWTMLAIWTRNTFLNEIVLFSFFACCLLVVRAVVHLLLGIFPAGFGEEPRSALVVLSVFMFSSAIPLTLGLYSLDGKSRRAGTTPPKGALSTRAVALLIVLPGFLASTLLSIEPLRAEPRPHGILYVWIAYISLLLIAVSFGGRSIHEVEQLKPKWWKMRLRWAKGASTVGFIIGIIACSALAFSAVYYIDYLPPTAKSNMPTYKGTRLQDVCERLSLSANRFLYTPAPSALTVTEEVTHDETSTTVDMHATQKLAERTSMTAVNRETVYVLLAPLFFFSVQFLAIRLQLGIIGRYYTEARREWLSRYGASSAMMGFGWFALGAVALLGPVLYDWFFSVSILKKVLAILGVTVLHAVTLYSGSSSKTSGKPSQGSYFGYKPLDLVGIIGAPLCILALLLICAGLLQLGISHAVSWGEWYRWEIAALAFGIFLFFGWRIDVNEFSLNGFYRNRLSRCYLGGTNPKRTPDPFTGFDDHTEATEATGMALSDFLPAKFGGQGFRHEDTISTDPSDPSDIPPYDGPFPIFCSTLNLTFGEDLGWQERKGASFAFTPLYTGYDVGWTDALDDGETTFNGFVPTVDYAYPNRGIRLSTATAVSGAALSPNDGNSTQPALAFLMTIFNVRLGWWIANPRRLNAWPSDRYRPTPLFGPRYLLGELFGMVDDTSNYVYLCDGGRFENMGLYELVRRRCKLIVVCDAEMDEHTAFEGIGAAISKCRTDFGAEITLNLVPMIPDDNGNAKLHFQVGSVKYPPPPYTDGTASYIGRIIYIKTSLTGDEPGDLVHHRRAYPGFPQDSTLNQWFTESQFESYRRLGQHIGEAACKYMTLVPDKIDPHIGIPT